MVKTIMGSNTATTCTDYRQEMMLLGLQRQLAAKGLSETERQRIAERIRELERQLGMD